MTFNDCSNNAASLSIAESSSALRCITAFLSGATYQDVTVSVSLSGTASSSDYSSDYLGRGYITINAGNTQASFSFDPSTDSLYEGNETLVVDMSNVVGGSATESGTQSITITITDDNSTPSLSINDVTTTNEGNTATNMTVTLSAVS